MIASSTRFRYTLAAILGLLAAKPAAAHLWTVTNLHPAGASESYAGGVHAGQQVGSVSFGGGFFRASLWTGTAASWVDLNPAGATSGAGGVYAGEQVGQAFVGGTNRAS